MGTVSTAVESVGSMPVAGGEFAKVVDTATALVVPTISGSTAEPAGQLEVIISFETQSVRYRTDGVNPAVGSGILITAPAVITFRGERMIKALRFISEVAGAKINYQFYQGCM